MLTNMDNVDETTQIKLIDEKTGKFVTVTISTKIKKEILELKAWLMSQGIIKNHKMIVPFKRVFSDRSFSEPFDPTIKYSTEEQWDALVAMEHQCLFTIMECDVYILDRIPRILGIGDK